jgi:uncharacterized protein YkwD
LRKLAAALLAVPVVAVLYVPVLLRRSVAARVGIAIGVGGLIGFGVLGLVTPQQTAANPPLAPIVPLTNDAFSARIAAGGALTAPVTIMFSAPMDATSVAASIQVEPATAVALSWSADGSRLTIAPKVRWAAATYHTITVRPGALGQSGRPMAVPARAVFMTRSATQATIDATTLAGSKAQVNSAFALTFDHPVGIDPVRAALTITPKVAGRLDRVGAQPGAAAFVFTPAVQLTPGKAYAVTLASLFDADGAPVEVSSSLAVKTTSAPKIVRFRPQDGTKDVARKAVLSVRFSQSMDLASTKDAFAVKIGDKSVPGSVSFAEKDSVLIFKPSSALPYGATVHMLVRPTARSAAGAPLAAPLMATIHVVGTPHAAAAPTRSTIRGSTSGSSGSSGGAVGGGSWGAVEVYYLKLMNCTRTGGWVTSTGSCSSPGGRNVAPLKLDSGISSKVSRPYAKRVAVNNQCSHFIGGNPGDRLRAAGYTSYIWAENLGCRSGNPYSAVLGSHLFFQSEKSYSGGHYVNLMNPKYDRCGIGVWVSSGRVRLVIDFYHPR